MVLAGKALTKHREFLSASPKYDAEGPSFLAGTSSTLFNGALLQLKADDGSNILLEAAEKLLEKIGETKIDVARYPNPFANWLPPSQDNPIGDLPLLTLVDAGETNQNIPLEPLLVPERGVDAIIAFDNSADTEYSWPNGSALRTTYERARELNEKQGVPLRMPAVPTEDSFVNGGLNARPVFFGCNDTTTTLLVYVPNYPWSAWSNVSTVSVHAPPLLERSMWRSYNSSLAVWVKPSTDSSINWTIPTQRPTRSCLTDNES